MNSSKALSMFIYYIFILIFSVQITAMEQPQKEFTLIDGLGKLPAELQSLILCDAQIPPHGYDRFGKSEFVSVDNNELTIGIPKKPAKEISPFYNADGTGENTIPEDKIRQFNMSQGLVMMPDEHGDRVPRLQACVACVNEPKIAVFDTEKSIAFQNFNNGFKLENKKIALPQEDAHEANFVLRNSNTFLENGTRLIFLHPLTDYYSDQRLRMINNYRKRSPLLVILDYDQKGNSAHAITIRSLNNFEDNKNTESRCANNKQFKLNNECKELHAIAKPFGELPDLIPLILKVATVEKNADDSKEVFSKTPLNALYNLREHELYGWPVESIPENPVVYLKMLTPRLPTAAELKQNIVPDNAISKTDLYILGLDEKAIEWTQQTINFISEESPLSADKGLTLIKQLNDANYARNILKLKSRAQFVLATRNGAHGDILKALCKKTELAQQKEEITNPKEKESGVVYFFKNIFKFR